MSVPPILCADHGDRAQIVHGHDVEDRLVAVQGGNLRANAFFQAPRIGRRPYNQRHRGPGLLAQGEIHLGGCGHVQLVSYVADDGHDGAPRLVLQGAAESHPFPDAGLHRAKSAPQKPR